MDLAAREPIPQTDHQLNDADQLGRDVTQVDTELSWGNIESARKLQGELRMDFTEKVLPRMPRDQLPERKAAHSRPRWPHSTHRAAASKGVFAGPGPIPRFPRECDTLAMKS